MLELAVIGMSVGVMNLFTALLLLVGVIKHKK